MWPYMWLDMHMLHKISFSYTAVGHYAEKVCSKHKRLCIHSSYASTYADTH